MGRKVIFISLGVLFLVSLLGEWAVSAEALTFPERTHAKADSVLLNLTTHEKMTPNGAYVIQIFKDDTWQEAGSLSFDKYLLEKEFDLGKVATNTEPLKIRLTEKGGGAAHIDSVFLGGMPPTEVKGVEDSCALKKLSKKDYDVIEAFEKTVEFTFAPQGKDKILRLTARVESTVISKIPFQFPVQNLYRLMNEHAQFYRYQLDSAKGGLKLNGNPAEISNQKPFFKEFSRTGSGHPSGFTYGWVRNDAENLYVVMDFTADNTYDGDKDYAKVYMKTEAGLKEFKVSVPETKWGKPFFTYTDKVPYQHKVYEFKIPLKELEIQEVDKPQEIQLAFAAYGTAAAERQLLSCVSQGNPPLIDGVVSQGEWPNLPQLTLDSPIAAKYYCLNDPVNLYVLVDATGDETDSSGACDECLLVWGAGADIFLAEIWGATGSENKNSFLALNGEAKMGFGSTPNSGTNHRFYEWKIPLASINASPGDVIDFSSPRLFKGACGSGASMPYDGSTGRDNVWPLGVDKNNRNTWGLLQLARCDQELCYDIIATDENGNASSDYWEVCLGNNGVGFLYSDNANIKYNLYLFGGGPGWFNASGSPTIGGNPQWSTWIARGANESGFLQPTGDGYLLTGEGVRTGNRYTVQGRKISCTEER
jgi:hypothetical protein